MSSPEKKSIDQRAAQDVRRLIAHSFLTLSNDLRREADALCVAHLQYDRPQLPPAR
jgi:hypothetical protein